MLVLQHRVGDKVYLTCPDGIVIVVLLHSIRDGGRVRLAYDAPRNVVIEREPLRGKLTAPAS